ncbi:MAG: Alkaline phosphatase [Firmicutes bacterium]|nr:Alkaline phosphatase [Bacillota bacterium]
MTVIIALIAVMLVSAFPHQQIATAGVDNGYAGKKAKYVFFFIGDGMGMPQVNAAEIFKGTLESENKMHKGKLGFTVFPNQGMQTTHSNNTFITESAAAGTALATGQKTNNDILGMDATKTVKLKTMAEMAKEKGMKVGIVSNVSIDHATPGAFYAHEPTRKNYYEIGLALVYGTYEPFSVTVTHILNQKAGIGWTTYAHTGVAIPVFAQGIGGELFQGYYDNTDIAKKIMNIMGVKQQ